MKKGVLFLGASLLAAVMGSAPAFAGSTFDYSLVDTSSQTDGQGGFSLTLNQSALNVQQIFVQGDLVANSFSFTFDGNTFNLSNGSLSDIGFQSGHLWDLTYAGSFIDKAGDRVTLDISGTRFAYYDQPSRGQAVETSGNLDFQAPAAVPEPSSAWLMLPALMLLGGVAARRKMKPSAAI
jgi:hypothetical protein